MPAQAKKRVKMVFNFPLDLAQKIRNRAKEDNINNITVIVNALNFYFEYKETMASLPKLIELYDSTLANSKKTKK